MKHWKQLLVKVPKVMSRKLGRLSIIIKIKQWSTLRPMTNIETKEAREAIMRTIQSSFKAC